MKTLVAALCISLSIIVSTMAASQPNIVFILVDDWGYGDANSKSSGIALPEIDAIAAAGVTFTNGYATASLCAPSRVGAFLGFSSQRLGLYDNPPTLPADWPERFGLPFGVTTLAEALHQLGYATAMFGKWHMGNRPDQHPLQRGFDVFLGMIGSSHPYYGEMDGNPILRGETPEPQEGYLTDVFADEAASFIHQHAAQPFYLYFSPNAVHQPYAAKPEILATLSYIVDPQRQLFAGALVSLSQAIGTITAALREEGIYDNTLIVLMGDNGAVAAGKSKPLRGRKGSLYEGGLRVPFFISWPSRLPAGLVYGPPVSALDLFPTFLAAAGGLPSGQLEGVDLLPYLTGELVQPDRYLYWAKPRNAAIRRGDWKLVGYGSTTELYNLAKDVSERHNVAARNPLIVGDLNRARLAWTGSLARAQ